MSQSAERYEVKFPKIQSWLRMRLPAAYRLAGWLYLRVLSVDRWKLWFALRRTVRHARKLRGDRLTFVQVGSNDGLTNDPIRKLILKRPSSAVLIEPVPSCFGRLQRNYERYMDPIAGSFDIRMHQLAIGPESGVQNFYAVSPVASADLGDLLPEWWDQIGSFEREHITRHLDGILEPYIIELKIPTVRLGDLLTSEKIWSVDLLHIDAEGFDLEVLRSLTPWNGRIASILVEWKHLTAEDLSDLERWLKVNKYSYRKFKSDLLAFAAES